MMTVISEPPFELVRSFAGQPSTWKIETILTFQRLTLDQIQVVGLLQNAAFEAANQAFEITTINIEESLQNHFDSRISTQTNSLNSL